MRLSAPTPLLLRIRLQFRVAKTASRGHWEAFTIAYSYSLHDGQDREILAYQWHPRGVSHVTFPHLHVGPGAQLGRQDLARAHLPTGLVALDDFLRLAITAFHVRPRRKDWNRILRSATVPIPLE
ncbi:MAG: hypothetical protein HY238_10225 [Acidobacteria bacterium]|nr:hypothetical protein [Acidobacteriota bacterium]